MKKQSKPIIHGNASPAEVFHRNLVDAVSNAEDSDENEHYVYPYSSNENLAATHAMHRPISVRSTPPTYLQHDITKKNYGTHNSSSGLGEWLKQTLYHSKPPRRQQHHFDEEEEDLCWSGNEQYRRPKLRNHVKDHLLQQNKPSLLNLWRESFNKKHTHNLLPTKKNRNPPQYATLPRKFSPYYCSATGRDGYEGYTSDDEEAPLLSRRQKRSSRPKKSCSTLPNLFLSLLTALIFLMVIVFYRAQPLVELTVDIGRVLATDKELIFDLKVQAENWNWWTIHIADADISVFAFSQIVPSVDPAEYLGNVRHFDEPLSIQSRQFGHNTKEAITLIRIKSPGADSSGNERWQVEHNESRMIRYPYGLVVRGVLKYRPIPFAVGMYPQSIAICNVTRVDPTTGTVSTDPDRTICANEDEVDIFSHVMRGTAL
ncbi:uncharacterized protein B0P05DRAFT_476962 [Gilbertella persicaria]|uniref:uncharacterized protein n=1 Tax=Gilbertella persicaria TaxID=101096 RepID=UPI00221F362A|nr:uncharacterized protein B0P05DRAFT_476962 [Gilbertella persicaria]KAI8062829.1 hypothetical protein B0P05DRAFT_476962 [Gilbertella persicaria]